MAIIRISAILLCFLFAIETHAQTAGEVLPPWTPGTLDIHEINTGRGSSTFFILPDGTTMLYDAGELDASGPAWRVPRFVAPRPDSTRQAGEWIARYILRQLQHSNAPRIDFALPSHFHGDHMGRVSEKSPLASSGSYRSTGFTTITDSLPIGTMLDRGWPEYDYPVPQNSLGMQNYRAFTEWQTSHNGMRVDRFAPGRNDQIVLLDQPDQYPTFEVRNIQANGEIWTGVANVTRAHFPDLNDIEEQFYPNENMCSIAFRLSYGRFDYYTGGDLYGIPQDGLPAWHDVETPVAQAIGGPVEVSVLNHHGYIDSQNPFFVSTLRPRVWIIPVWDSAHPSPMVYKRLQSQRLYPGPRDIFATNMHESNRQVVVGLDRLASDQGHILVRVAPGGETYVVIIIEDADETGTIKSVHGPYQSR